MLTGTARTMEALYLGNNKGWAAATARGSWPDWRTACSPESTAGSTRGDPSAGHRLLTTTLKGGPNQWTIRSGNAQSGGLSTFYDGVRPNAPGHNPMKKQGAINLGIGGDTATPAAARSTKAS